MHLNPPSMPSPTSAGQGNVNGALRRRQQTPERCRAAVTEHGTVAQSQDSRHPPPIDACCDVADGIDAAVEAVQAT